MLILSVVVAQKPNLYIYYWFIFLTSTSKELDFTVNMQGHHMHTERVLNTVQLSRNVPVWLKNVLFYLKKKR